MEQKTTNTILLSTAYLPSVEYFYYLTKYNKVIIEQHESYPKQTYRNRCEIYAERGKMPLIVPVKKIFGNNTTTNDIQIFNEEKWHLNHWRAIEAAYLASPFFLYYRDELESFYTGEYENLLKFNTGLTTALCDLIGLEVDLSFTEKFERTTSGITDLRFALSPKKPPTSDNFPEYIQVFGDRHGFIPNLSIVDLLFNLGPETGSYLKNLN